ncbi:MAG: kelch repeat-containing protein [Bacteroidia bacterium]
MRKLLLLISFATICGGITAQNIWNKRASCGGSKRERSVSFSIASRGYIGLGQDTLNLMLKDLWEYDPATNSWTQKANFPGAARRDAASFVIGTKAYVGTGMDNADAFIGSALPDFYQYDPGTNMWTAKANWPGNSGMGTYYTCGFAAAGKGYFCCGKDGPSNYNNNLWRYDPVANSWLQMTDMPGAKRYGAVAFVIGNYAYFGTGTDENVLVSDFYRYDVINDLWSSLNNFPGTGRYSCSSFVVAGKGYILLGTDGGYKDELWQYDQTIDYWFPKANLPGGARRSAGAFAIGSKGYAGTGKGLTGTRRDFWEYLPSIPLGIEEHSDDVFSNVYPNPITDQATVVINSMIFDHDKNLFYDIMDMNGKVVNSEKINSASFTIGKNQLSKGYYLLSIRSSEKRLAAKKIVIQ